MKFLSLSTALWIAAIAVPLLVLLYFLKLRRHERKISSTYLWRKAVQDLQVNAPFQKIRRNLLLLLQLLVLAAIIFGLAGPVANFMRQPERNIVLLIDRSGSMKTVEADGRTRLEHAQDAAADFIEDMPDESRAMVVSFADRAQVVCNFTGDRKRLESLIRAIEPSDAPSRIGEALELAAAYSTKVVDTPDGGSADGAVRSAADMELFSDGRIEDAEEQFITSGHMTYYRVGEAVDNVGIVEFSVDRNPERPGTVTVFAQLENFGPTPVTTDLSMTLDGKLLTGPGSVQEVSLGAARPATTQPAREESSTSVLDEPAARSVIFEFFHEQGGLIEIVVHRKDAFMTDNRAAAPVEPPRALRILCVSDRGDFRYLVNRALTVGLELEDVTWMDTAEYESAGEDDLAVEGRSAFDLVVLDDHDTARLWPGNYLFFGCVPKIEGVSLGEKIEKESLAIWKEGHPLLRNSMLDGVYISAWRRLVLPPQALPLAQGEDSVVMALMTDPGHRYVMTAFDLLDTDMPMRPAFLILLQNTVQYLARGGAVAAGHLMSPGDTLSVPIPPGATEMKVRRPDGTSTTLELGDRVTATYGETQDTGIYRLTFDDSEKTTEIYSANILNRVESLVAPNETFSIGAEEVARVDGEIKVNEPLWPYAVMAALFILLIEWWIYNRRVMI